MYLFIWQLYKSHNKKQKNVNRYITIFRYQMLELWATSLFDNGYIWFYIPTMESFVNAGIWLTGPIFNPSRISIYVNLCKSTMSFHSPYFSRDFFHFFPCSKSHRPRSAEPQDLKSQRPSVPATRALRTLHSAWEVVGPRKCSGILQLWPFISYKY